MKIVVTSTVILISFFIMMMSVWGVGKSSRDNDAPGKNTAVVFWSSGLVVFVVGMIMAVYMPDIENYCVK